MTTHDYQQLQFGLDPDKDPGLADYEMYAYTDGALM